MTLLDWCVQTCRWLCLAAWTILAPVSPLLAQSTAPLEDDDLSHRPLDEALVTFQTATGISLIYGQELVRGKQTDSVHADPSQPQRLLADLLDGTDLEFFRLPSGRYALRPQQPAGVRYGSLVGVVLDETTKRPLPGAHVLVTDASRGTATDREGLFAISALRPGRYLVTATHVGYHHEIDTVNIAPEQHTDVQLSLRPEPIKITPIVIEGLTHRQEMGFGTLWSPTQGELMAGLGTIDVIRSLDHLPGVQVGNGLADVHVQGGETGEHQFQLDGVPVFEPVHLQGLIGAFNPFAIRQISVHKAGFGAEYGSYLSGIIAAEHALHSPDGHALDLQVDALSANGRLNLEAGRPGRLQGQLMVAGRKSLWSLYQPPHLNGLLRDWNEPDPFLSRASLLAALEDSSDLARRLEEGITDSLRVGGQSQPDLAFNDVHAAGQLRFNNQHHLYASYYRGWNELAANRLPLRLDTTQQRLPVDQYEWTNENGQLRYMTFLNSRTLLGVRVRGSQYRLGHSYTTFNSRENTYPLPGHNLEIRYDIVPADDGNHITEWAVESTLDIAQGPGSNLQAGIEAVRTSHRFTIDDIYYRPITQESASSRVAAFLEKRTLHTQRLTTTLGSRLTLVPAQESFYLEPRAEARYDHPASPIGPWSARAAIGLYRQFVNQFDMSSVSPSAVLPAIRFWLPVDASVRPPKAYHAAGEVLLTPNSSWRLQGELYYKKQPHTLLIDYPSLWQRLRGRDTVASAQEDFLRSASGHAYGGSFEVRRTGSTAKVFARYDYSISEREYTFVDTTSYEPAPWNEPHRFELGLDWKPVDALMMTLRWQGGWGRTWAFRKAYYDYLATDSLASPTYGDIDLRDPSSHRLPAFQQLDLSTAYTREVGPITAQIRMDLLNLFNRENVADLSLKEIRREDDEGEEYIAGYESVPRTLLPRTLLLAVRLRW